MNAADTEAPTPERKRIASATARCALAGAVLTVLPGDDGWPEFIVTQRALTRAFETLAEVEAWLDSAEGRRHGWQSPP